MKHITLIIIIGILVAVSSCSCGPPAVNLSTQQQISKEYNVTPNITGNNPMQPIQVGEEVYLNAQEQARIQKIQAKLRLLNVLISETQDSTELAFYINKYIELADSLPPTEQTGAYIALAISKTNRE